MARLRCETARQCPDNGRVPRQRAREMSDWMREVSLDSMLDGENAD